MRAVLRNSRASRKGLLASPAFSTPRALCMVATGQEMVREKNSSKSGKCQGILFWVTENWNF